MIYTCFIFVLVATRGLRVKLQEIECMDVTFSSIYSLSKNNKEGRQCPSPFSLMFCHSLIVGLGELHSREFTFIAR